VFLAASLLLSVAFAARVPLDGNPDEHAHLDYIRLLVEERGFVRFIPREQLPPGAPSRDETHQSPLYYLLCVPVYALAGGSVFVLRLVAALLQLATIVVAFRAVRDLFPGRSELAAGAAAFVAFLPTQAQLAGAINNDGLATLVAVAMFWRLGRLVRGGEALDVRRETLFLGALLGLGLLTKLSVLQLLPAVLLAFLVAARAGGVPIKGALTGFAIVTVLGLLIASPWLARNTLLYGDPLTLGIYRATGPNFTPRQVMDASGWDVAEYARNVGVRSFATFWYFLPPDLPFTRFTGSPAPLLAVLLLAVAGSWGAYRWWRVGEGSAAERRIVGLFAAGVVLLVPFFARFVFTVFQAQGRYFLPVLLPVALVTCLGIATLTPRRPAAGALGVGALLLAFTLYTLTGGRFGG
jgi:4-amino-4-deoxy-L-arabinose transferase-like glycosyltransferase